MGLWSLFLIAVGLSMDAFAVAICIGLAMEKNVGKKAVIVGLYFGVFQAGMPLIGYLLGSGLADVIEAYDHWIAFGLLVFIGGRMVYGSLKKAHTEEPVEECEEMDLCITSTGGGEEKKDPPLGFRSMLPLALATSIDALAVGISFAFLQVRILPAIGLIGFVTFVLSVAGAKIGNAFGAKYEKKATLAGGLILILMGLKILLEHTGIIS